MTDVEVPPFWRMVVNEALKPFFAFQVTFEHSNI